MTKLEEVPLVAFSNSRGRETIIAAAKLDNEAFYQQGVEDAVSAYRLAMLGEVDDMENEIRQRLERLKGTDNG